MTLRGVPASMIKELTLEKARSLIGEGGTQQVYIETHSEGRAKTLSGIIVIQGLNPDKVEHYRCDALTKPLDLKETDDGFWASLLLRGRTLHIDIVGRGRNRRPQGSVNSAHHTF